MTEKDLTKQSYTILLFSVELFGLVKSKCSPTSFYLTSYNKFWKVLITVNRKWNRWVLLPSLCWTTESLHQKMLTLFSSIPVVAFVVGLHQNKQLLGLKGLLPASQHLDKIRKQTDTLDKYYQVPSLIWLVDYSECLDDFLDYIAYAGIGLSGNLSVLKP